MGKDIALAALDVAKREVGVKEFPAGSNTGPRVKDYLASVPIPPAPWCAAFVTWCLKEVGWQGGDWNLAFCPSWVQAGLEGKAGMRVLGRTEKPEPGDLALYDWDGGVADHIGIVAEVHGLFEFTAVEGNTSFGNDSNGGEVMYRRRHRQQCEAIIRLPRVKVSLPTRLRAGGYGARTVAVILRNLKAGVSGDIAHPKDRERFQKLTTPLAEGGAGLSPESARKVIKSIRRKRA